MKTNSQSNHTSSQNGTKKASTQKETKGSAVPADKLMELFEDELKDIYWAEKALTKALPKMIKKVTSPELAEAITNHLEETNEHVTRLEQVFESIGEKVQSKKCEAMSGLLKEADELMTDTDEGGMRDAAIIAAAQKVEHYEIATYGTLRAWAELLGLDKAVELLGATLQEEKNADEKLTDVAESAVNIQALSEEESE